MTVEPISLIIPAWNEEHRIGRSIDRILDEGATLGIGEVIIVDDGSTDDTAAIVRARVASHEGLPRLRLIPHEVNRGKGAALRTGLLAATSPLIGYLDADLSIGPAPFRAARALIADGADIVVGYRISYTGLPDGKGQLRLRRFLSMAFKRVQRWLIGLSVRDTQCPFKLFTRQAVAQVVPPCRLDGWAFDVEVLHLATRAGLRIEELPVPWEFADGSTVHLDAWTAWRTLRELFIIRRTHGA